MLRADLKKRSLTHDEAAVLNSVLYFSVFNWPLTEQELYENSAPFCTRKEFPEVLKNLLNAGLLKKSREYYLSSDADESAVCRRKKGNAEAAAMMSTAYSYSRKIASFPFVRGICLSGALSKNYYDKNGDIDYFIITEPGRLWICRTLLILKYKMMSPEKRKLWCVNYFVSADNLTISDRNVYTATELAYLIPTYNYELYRRLLENNKWYRTQFSKKPLAKPDLCWPDNTGLFKRITEALFTGWGDILDSWLLKISLRRWMKKYPELNCADFELQFRSRKDVCKRHQTGFQNKVLQQWQQRKFFYEKIHQISLSV